MDVEGSAGLPVEEERIRSAIAAQIRQFGMDNLTSRIIREKLKESFGFDFSNYKAAVDKITMSVIESNAEKEKSEGNGGGSKSDSESDDGVVFTDRAPRKKIKNTRKRKSSESDSELLEVGQKRRRAAAAPKQTGQKKNRGNNGSGTKPRRKNSYNVCCALTNDLAALCGKRYMRRCDVIKTMWAYFKSNNLLDPKNKRYVLSDEHLMKIFKKKRFLAFGIMKDLAAHIIEPKFLDDEERAALEKYEAEEEARREAESNAEVKANGGEALKVEEINGGVEKVDSEIEDDENDEENESS